MRPLVIVIGNERTSSILKIGDGCNIPGRRNALYICLNSCAAQMLLITGNHHKQDRRRNHRNREKHNRQDHAISLRQLFMQLPKPSFSHNAHILHLHLFGKISILKFIHPGVWLSLARAPGLGPGSRRFESCHPDYPLTETSVTPSFSSFSFYILSVSYCSTF